MTFDAVCISGETLVGAGKRSRRYLSICGGGQEEAEAQYQGAAKESEIDLQMIAFPRGGAK